MSYFKLKKRRVCGTCYRFALQYPCSTLCASINTGVSTFTVTFGNPDEQALKIMYFPLRGLADLPAMMLVCTPDERIFA